MKIAVLACGPSLVRHFDPKEAFDMVVAVNTAGWLYACDWLAFSDRHIVDPIVAGEHPWPRAGMLTNTGWKSTAAKLGLEWAPLPIYDWRLKNLNAEMSGLCIEQGMTECGFTFPNALFFAGQRKPDELHVFGFDCAMTEEDVAGVKGYHNRKRWCSELPWIRAVLRGMPVTLRCDAADNVKRWVRCEFEASVWSLFPEERAP